MTSPTATVPHDSDLPAPSRPESSLFCLDSDRAHRASLTARLAAVSEAAAASAFTRARDIKVAAVVEVETALARIGDGASLVGAGFRDASSFERSVLILGESDFAATQAWRLLVTQTCPVVVRGEALDVTDLAAARARARALHALACAFLSHG